MKNVLISVIIPVYNAERFLEQCLGSITAQTYEKLEIIIIDDGSTDSSDVVYKKLMGGDARIRVVRQPNKGVSAARNNGLRIAEGEYVVFVDADDYIDCSMIEKMVHKLGLCPDIVICNMARVHRDESIELTSYKWEYDKLLSSKQLITDVLVDLVDESQKTIAGAVWGKMIRREVAKKIKFDTIMRIHEDQKWLLEVLQECKNGVSIKDHLYYYRDNDASAINKSTESDILDKEKNVRLINAFAEQAGEDIMLCASKYSFMAKFGQYKCGVMVGIGSSRLKELREDVKKRYVLLAPEQKNMRNRCKLWATRLPTRIFRIAFQGRS